MPEALLAQEITDADPPRSRPPERRDREGARADMNGRKPALEAQKDWTS